MRVFVRLALAIVSAGFTVALCLHPAAAGDKRWLLVGGDSCCVDAYPTDDLNPRRAYRLHSGEESAQGVDRAGRLYTLSSVSGIETVSVYPPRSRKPSLQFALVEKPTQMAVAPDGTVYLGGDRNIIAVYPPGQTKRSRLIQVKTFLLGTITSMHVEPRTGVLFISSYAFSATRGIQPSDEYFDTVFWARPGSNVATPVFGVQYGSPGFLDTDTQGRVIVSLTNGVGVYCPKHWRLCRFFSMDFEPQALAYDPSTDRLYVVRIDNEVLIYDYETGLQVGQIAPGIVRARITVSPVLP